MEPDEPEPSSSPTHRPDLVDLLAAFRSPEPTPGGGSASALAGARGRVAAGDGRRTARSRARDTEEDPERLRRPASACARFGDRLAVLVDRDSEAYELVVAAYRLPKATDEEKAARSAAIQEALRGGDRSAARRHARLRATARAGRRRRRSSATGTRRATCGSGSSCSLAALRGARLNVEINLGTA